MQLANYFLWFMFYSSIGWFYESIFCSLQNQHKIINRGYLHGPYCPIYGVGLVVNMILLKDVKDIIALFVIAAITSGIMEYSTSYIMEKLFGARWWDYSDHHLNINGRICLTGCIFFGFGNVVLLKYIHPYVSMMTGKIGFKGSCIMSVLLFFIITTDIIFTTIRMNNLNCKLKNVKDKVNSCMHFTISFIDVGGKGIKGDKGEMKNEGISLKLTDIKEYVKNSELRILHFIPKCKSIGYSEIVHKIKETIL